MLPRGGSSVPVIDACVLSGEATIRGRAHHRITLSHEHEQHLTHDVNTVCSFARLMLSLGSGLTARPHRIAEVDANCEDQSFPNLALLPHRECEVARGPRGLMASGLHMDDRLRIGWVCTCVDRASCRKYQHRWPPVQSGEWATRKNRHARHG